MERLTEKDSNGNYKIEVKKLEYWCTSGDGKKPDTVRGQHIDRLAEFEDLEEQGRLLKLPAAVGDKVFQIFMSCPKDYKEEYCSDHEGSCANCHHRVPEIVSSEFRISGTQDMGKIFTTREEAEAALKEVNGGTGK